MSPSEFWGNNYYKHPPLSTELIYQFEETFRVKLPLLLIELLNYQNGGYTKDFGYPMNLKTSWGDSHVPFDAMSGIVIDPTIKTAFNLMDGDYLQAEWGLPPKQILLNGTGAWWVSLDFRSSTSPSVLWIDTDVNEMVPIAPSFNHFYDGLRPISEFIVE